MEYSKSKKSLLILVILLLLIGAAYMLTAGDFSFLSKKSVKNDKTGVEVKYVQLDQAKTDAEKLPQGFPEGIPVEAAVVTESYAAKYQDPPATQYTVTFRTSKSVEAKYKEYVDYLTAEGYQISEGDKNAPVKTLQATKANDDFLAVISKLGSSTQVQVGFLDRP